MPWPESWPIRGEDVALAASAATIKDSTSVGAAEGGPPLLWRRPKAASIMVDGEAANIAIANTYSQ